MAPKSSYASGLPSRCQPQPARSHRGEGEGRDRVHLGFEERDAKRALDLVSERHANDATPPPKEILLREALSVLA